MAEDSLLSWTKDVLKHLVNREPGVHAIHSLASAFYNRTRIQIPFHEFGHDCLLTFLQSIPDTLNVNRSTFEVQPAIESEFGECTSERFAETPPHPYSEVDDDLCTAPVHCSSFAYDRDYYLLSPEVEVNVDDDTVCTTTEMSEPICISSDEEEEEEEQFAQMSDDKTSPPPYSAVVSAAPVHLHPCSSFAYDRDYYLKSPAVELNELEIAKSTQEAPNCARKMTRSKRQRLKKKAKKQVEQDVSNSVGLNVDDHSAQGAANAPNCVRRMTRSKRQRLKKEAKKKLNQDVSNSVGLNVDDHSAQGAAKAPNGARRMKRLKRQRLKKEKIQNERNEDILKTALERRNDIVVRQSDIIVRQSLIGQSLDQIAQAQQKKDSLLEQLRQMNNDICTNFELKKYENFAQNINLGKNLEMFELHQTIFTMDTSYLLENVQIIDDILEISNAVICISLKLMHELNGIMADEKKASLHHVVKSALSKIEKNIGERLLIETDAHYEYVHNECAQLATISHENNDTHFIQYAVSLKKVHDKVLFLSNNNLQSLKAIADKLCTNKNNKFINMP